MRPSDLIDDAGRARIEAAVAEAERATSGEIVVKVVRACDEYGSAGWRLGVGLAAIALLAIGLFGELAAPSALAAQALALVAGHGLGRVTPLRRLLVSEDAMQLATERCAAAAFAEHGLHRTRARTGILLLVALFEHRVVVLADEGVNRRLAPDHSWQEVVERVLAGVRGGAPVEGLVSAVSRCGEILSGPLPSERENPDEIHRALVLED